MTARPIASATIQFGLVSIPVKLFTTNESADDISFNWLHDADHARLQQLYVCTSCSAVVDKEHTVKGFEHAPGQYAIFTKAELEALDAVSTNQIAIDRFVPSGELDPVYYDGASYLCPDKGSEQSFALLVQALADTKRIAIGKYSAKGRETIVAIASRGYGLDLYRLKYEREVRSVAELPDFEAPRIAPAERNLARDLVRQMSDEALDLDRYSDEVLARRRQLINDKIAGGELVASPAAAPNVTNPVDLVEALRASLDVSAPAPKQTTPIAPPAPATSHKKLAGKKPRGGKARVAATTKKRPKARRGDREAEGRADHGASRTSQAEGRAGRAQDQGASARRAGSER